MAQKRLLWQLFPSYLLITLISLVAVTIFASYSITEIYREDKSADLRSHLALLDGQVREILGKNPADLDGFLKEASQQSNVRFTFINPDGTVIADSDQDPALMDNHTQRPEIAAALHGATGSSTRYSETIDTDLIYVAVPLYEESRLLGVFRASVPLHFIENTVSLIRLRILYSAIIISSIVAIISLILARNISRPLEMMQEGVQRFADGELSFRISRPVSREFAKLTDALNQMAGQLDEKITQIIQQKNEQKAVFESMVESVLAVDSEGRILNLNQAAMKIFQIEADDVTGNKIEELIRNKDLVDLIRKTLDRAEPVEDEIYFSDKKKYYLQFHGTVLKSTSGNVIGAVIVLNDVTRLRRLEKIRQDFVANVSHEIRTPLTSIKGFAETLLDGAIDDPETARGFIRIINNQSNRLNAIIEDLLTLARMEQEDERIQIEFKQDEISRVIASALQVCGPNAQKKSIQVDVKTERKIFARINPDLLEQAIVNLVDNAIKFSPEKGKIEIDVVQTKNDIRISVTDHGVGIEKKHLSRLFERFYRVDKARSRRMGGTGLGLAIVKHIVQVHGGNVSVESAPEKGSRFTITLPFN